MSTEHTLLNLMTDGGWVMWALLALSLASLAVALERSWVLYRALSSRVSRIASEVEDLAYLLLELREREGLDRRGAS